MNVIGNYSLIADAKSDSYTCLERGTYSVYHEAIHFAQFAISKCEIFGKVLMIITHIYFITRKKTFLEVWYRHIFW